MTDSIKWMSFEELAVAHGQNGGRSGPAYRLALPDRIENADGPYTVYWPNDYYRVFETGSLEIALFMAALLRDPRTLWCGRSAHDLGSPEIGLPRRELREGRVDFQSSQKKRNLHYDRLIAGDIYLAEPSQRFTFAEPGDERLLLDTSTIPLG